MATLPVIRYPLDPTGTSPDNLVQGELHTLPARLIRAVATTYGAFYTESIVVRDTSNNQVLTKGVQYYPAELYEIPTAKFGKEVCAIIVITDPSVSSEISLQYQAVGGEFSSSVTAVIQQIEALNLDDRPIEWGSIIDKPDEYPPSHHLHDAGDIYGFEYVVHALDRIRAAILMGDDVSHDTIYQYIDAMRDGFESADSQNAANLQAHITNTNNPHQVTLAQLNGYTKPEVDALIADNNTTLSNQINAHATRTDNPHAVTATQVGLGNVGNYPMASNPEALAGTANDRYMSPLRVQEAINQHAGSGAHDGRYVLKDTVAVNGSIHVSGGIAYVAVGGAWRAFWPPQWQ
jgi:hypothetical protein